MASKGVPFFIFKQVVAFFGQSVDILMFNFMLINNIKQENDRGHHKVYFTICKKV